MDNNNSLSLWQIGSEYQSLLSQLYDHETGEINQEIDDQLTALAPTAETKCTAVAKWIKVMESEKQQIEFMKQEILKRESAYTKEINRQMDYLKYNMERCKITEIKCPQFTIKIKTNPYSTDVFDESQVPEKYMRSKTIIRTEIKPDRIAIKEEVLKTGIQVPGAAVEQKTKLEIIVDKI